jgi:DNA repair exonuclease SbcCD ATPase subunit
VVGPILSAEEHYAKGEVQFGEAWVLIDNLFKDYLAARAELAPLDAKARAARDNVASIQAQMNSMKNDTYQSEQPIRKDIGKQTNKRRELTKASEALEPAKPRLQQIPQRPRQYAANVHSSSSSSSSSSSNQYQQMMDDWQQQVDIITRANTEAQKKYQTDKTAWKKAKDDADKELPKVDQALKDLQGKLEQNAAALVTKQAPLMEKIKAANEEAQGIVRLTEAVQTRIKAMADALKAAPEALRFKHGILDWEGAFWPLADLEKQLTETQAEINLVTAQMKTEAADAGRPIANNWRHPQQDRLDALKTLITRAKAAA